MSGNNDLFFNRGFLEPHRQEDCDNGLDSFYNNPMMVANNDGPSNEYMTPDIFKQINNDGRNYLQIRNDFTALSVSASNSPLKSDNIKTFCDGSGVNDSNMLKQEGFQTGINPNSVFSQMSEFSTPEENDELNKILNSNAFSTAQHRDKPESYTDSLLDIDLKNADPATANSNDESTEEEKRRKINRDAQRAFRKRKEEKLKEMELKWMNSENDKKRLLKENDDLKKQSFEICQENKELFKKATATSGSDGINSNIAGVRHGNKSFGNDNNTLYNFPNKTEYVQFIYDDTNHGSTPNINELPDLEYKTSSGEEALTVPKTWEYLSTKLHEKEQEGYTFDTWHIMNLMKGNEVCHGSGAAYMKSYVDSTLEENLKEL